jgi:hypothetical protein
MCTTPTSHSPSFRICKSATPSRFVRALQAGPVESRFADALPTPSAGKR